MVKIYVRKIQRDESFTIDNVPELWRSEVQALLEEAQVTE